MEQSVDKYQTETENTAIYKESIEKIIKPISDLIEYLSDNDAEFDDFEFTNLLSKVIIAKHTIIRLLLDSYEVLGLVGEAGEIANKYKKIIRGDKNYRDFKESVKGEIGDVQWYLARIATSNDLKLSEVLESNLDKLLDRKEREVIRGDGDKR